MFIVTIDIVTRAVLSYYVPSSPLNLKKYHDGDNTKVFLGRETFPSKEAVTFFRNNYRKFRVTTDGRPERFS